MPFYLYEKKEIGNEEKFNSLMMNAQLAGRNGGIYKCWCKKGKPINEGWIITIDELTKELTNGHGNSIVIDFFPKQNDRIALLEILKIYAYTYVDAETGRVVWTPLMLELREIYNEEFKENIDSKKKDKIIKEFTAPKRTKSGDEIIFEFLYLQGD